MITAQEKQQTINNNNKTIPDTYLPLIGQNFSQKYAYLGKKNNKNITFHPSF